MSIEKIEYNCETSFRNEIIHYQWKIKDFSKCSRNMDSCLASNYFHDHYHNESFFLFLILDKLRLGIWSKNKNRSIKNISIGIIDAKGKQSLKKIVEVTGGFLPGKDVIFKKPKEYMPNDTLTIFVEMICQFPVNQQIEKVNAFIKIKDNIKEQQSKIVPHIQAKEAFAQMYKEKLFSDVKFVINGKEFLAHKVVLAVRCPSFRKLFKENSEHLIEFRNVNANAFEQMLEYIYTENIVKINNMEDELLVLSNEYKLDGLKIICEENLSKKLNWKNAAYILIIAVECNANTLKKNAIAFISETIKDVIKTPEYDLIIKSYPYLISEIIEVRSTQKLPRIKPKKDYEVIMLDN